MTVALSAIQTEERERPPKFPIEKGDRHRNRYSSYPRERKRELYAPPEEQPLSCWQIALATIEKLPPPGPHRAQVLKCLPLESSSVSSATCCVPRSRGWPVERRGTWPLWRGGSLDSSSKKHKSQVNLIKLSRTRV